MNNLTKKMTKLFKKQLKPYSQIIYIVPAAHKSKSNTYDPDFPKEKNSWNKSFHNKIGFKCYVRFPTSNMLIIKELGLKEIDAREIYINEKHLDFLKKSEKIIIEGKDYTVWNEGCGNKIQIFRKRGIGLIEVLVFKKIRK